TYRLVDFVSPDPKWTGKNPLQVRLSAQLTACPPASDSENHAASGAAVSITCLKVIRLQPLVYEPLKTPRHP
ncbi:MAG: hypothetical protein AAB425_15460, partial [Bdellovibrionota bacterium]